MAVVNSVTDVGPTCFGRYKMTVEQIGFEPEVVKVQIGRVVVADERKGRETKFHLAINIPSNIDPQFACNQLAAALKAANFHPE